MKPYLITTAILFAFLTVLHIWRAIVEGPHLAAEPWFILITLASTVLCVWALRLLSRWPKS